MRDRQTISIGPSSTLYRIWRDSSHSVWTLTPLSGPRKDRVRDREFEELRARLICHALGNCVERICDSLIGRYALISAILSGIGPGARRR
jgi:hypothetical protein